MRVALIDADSILYIIGWLHRDHDDEAMVKRAIDQYLQDIILATETEAYLGVFSPKKTFRNDITDTYKANRPAPHPGILKWKSIVQEYLVKDHGFIVGDNIEADDVLSILGRYNEQEENQTVNKYEWILCHIDKDLRQVPGTHYNYSKKTWEEVGEDQARLNLWTQVLVGDTGDNVRGAWKIGPVKAAKLLDGQNPSQYEEIVREAFLKANGETGTEDFEKAVSLLRLLDPTEELVDLYLSKIQMVKFDDNEGIIESLLNYDSDNGDVLQGRQRPHPGDVLRSPDDFS